MKTNLTLCLTIVLILCICCKGKRDKAYHHGRNESNIDVTLSLTSQDSSTIITCSVESENLLKWTIKSPFSTEEIILPAPTDEEISHSCVHISANNDGIHIKRTESEVIKEFRVPIQLLSSKDKLILESKATLLGISGSTLIIDYSYKTTESNEWLQDLIIIDRFRLEIIKIASTNMVETIKGSS